MARSALITEPLTVSVDGFVGGKAISIHRKLAGGVATSVGASLLVEQRILQSVLGLGDLVKKRKKEREGQGLLPSLIDKFGLDHGHYSDPLHHCANSALVILQSWALTLVWLIEMKQNYAKAIHT